MKIEEIPDEGERVDLSKLPQEAELKADHEDWQEPQSGKTGGLVITYEMRDGKQFPQKYSKISGAVLIKALKALKIKDSQELQGKWYKYVLTPMRTGYPRMIPVEKVKA